MKHHCCICNAETDRFTVVNDKPIFNCGKHGRAVKPITRLVPLYGGEDLFGNDEKKQIELWQRLIGGEAVHILMFKD